MIMDTWPEMRNQKGRQSGQVWKAAGRNLTPCEDSTKGAVSPKLRNQGLRLKFMEILHHLCPQRVEMDVPCKFSKIRLLLAHNTLESVLKKMPTAPVPTVELAGVTAHQRAHASGKRTPPRSHHEVKVIGKQCPSVNYQGPRSGQGAHTPHKVIPVLVARKIFRLSIPRAITWCRTPGASSLAKRGTDHTHHNYNNYATSLSSPKQSLSNAGYSRGYRAAISRECYLCFKRRFMQRQEALLHQHPKCNRIGVCSFRS